MRSIICLGTKACDVGELFEAQDEHIKLIDIDIEGDNCYSIPPQKSAEEYEKNTPDLSSFFSGIRDQILFIISGESDVINCSLKVLQQIKDKKISIVYIVPQREFMSSKQILQERVVRSVLQEYTRSGLFHEMILLDNVAVESVMSETSIKDFESKFNETLRNLIRNYSRLESEEKIIDQASRPTEISKIITFGYYDLQTDSERMCYNLSLISDKIYHFYFSEETLNGNAKTLRELKNKVKTKAVDNTRVSYTIRNAATDFCFVVYYSKAIQQ